MAVLGADHKPLILVSSQEPDFTECLRIFLEEAGYRVVTTDAAAPALGMARGIRPDLVILALSREKIREAIDGLRAREATREMPIVVLSAASPDLPEFGPYRELWQAYVQMPLELDDVLGHVARLLGRD